jgi:hypothetical protein
MPQKCDEFGTTGNFCFSDGSMTDSAGLNTVINKKPENIMLTGFWCSLKGGGDATRIASDPSICLVNLTLFAIMDIDALGN